MNIELIKNKLAALAPRHWIRNYPTDESLDYAINKLLDEGCEFVIRNNYEADLGPMQRVWIANYPYAFLNRSGCMPKRSTVIRAYKALKEARAEYFISEVRSL